MATKKKFSVLCPVHQLWAFQVEAKDEDDALQVFKKSNPLELVHYATHDWTDAAENVLDPIEVRGEYKNAPMDVKEIETGYIPFLRTQGRREYERLLQTIDAEGKVVPFWYRVDFALLGGLSVAATSEAEARKRAVKHAGDIEWDLKQPLDDGAIFAVERVEEAGIEDLDEGEEG